MNEIIFKGLNQRQKEAVKVLKGPLLILAGAGSGKTKTLTHRIANLIANGVSGEQILAVTFTNKAAAEMKSRIEIILKNFDSFRLPEVGTFHSICVRILRKDIPSLGTNLSQNFVIFDSDDSKALIKTILKELGYDDKIIKFRAIASHISSAKNQLMTPSEYVLNTEDNRFTEAVKKVFPLYQKRLEEHNALDFDDLLQKTVQLFEKNIQILEPYRKKWHHLMVDEYQDTNFAQYRLVRLLSDGHHNLCVIGDDHQSIYRFRGADYTNILNFEKDFPMAKTIKLEQNYRSSANILANANSLISHNETGQKKRLWTENNAGNPVKIIEAYNDREEGNIMAQNIQEFVREGVFDYSDFAILYRMNAQSRSIEEALMRAQIPYQIVGGIRFFDRKEVKDILAYLRLIFNPRDDIAFLRIINTPTRKLGKSTIDIVKVFANNYSMSLFEILEHIEDIDSLNTTKKTALKNFRNLIKEIQTIVAENPISMVIDRLLEKTNFLSHLDDGTEEGENRKQNVKELFSVAMRYDSAENPLADFLEGVSLVADIDRIDTKSKMVTLMTIHSSKGLEFPHVFLPGWEDGIFPSNRLGTKSQDDFEEERRLGYVAITRAEKTCTILHSQQRMLFGQTQCNPASSFLSELDENCIEYTKNLSEPRYSQENSPWGGNKTKNFWEKSTNSSFGKPMKQKDKKMFSSSKKEALFQPPPKTKNEAVFGVSDNTTGYTVSEKIIHPEWGTGTIIQISGDILTVAFSGTGMKKIVASIAPIEKVF